MRAVIDDTAALAHVTRSLISTMQSSSGYELRVLAVRGEHRVEVFIDEESVAEVAAVINAKFAALEYNEMVAADTEDWYDSPTGGQHD